MTKSLIPSSEVWVFAPSDLDARRLCPVGLCQQLRHAGRILPSIVRRIAKNRDTELAFALWNQQMNSHLLRHPTMVVVVVVVVVDDDDDNDDDDGADRERPIGSLSEGRNGFPDRSLSG